jgi:acyl phosphate:glycerol-3-phosphate acyltransferase
LFASGGILITDYWSPNTEMLWIPIAFLSGSLPFSVWLGWLALRLDIRGYGDRNPGATNVLRAGGWPWFALALILDISKAAAPVGYTYQILGIRGWEMVAIAVAPVLGHAFSPFLRGQGGKAVAATLGAWIGLTLYTVPLVGIVGLGIAFSLLTISGWAVMGALTAVLLYLLLFQPDPLLLVTLAGHVVILVWKHRQDLRQRPGVRPFWKRKRGHG